MKAGTYDAKVNRNLKVDVTGLPDNGTVIVPVPLNTDKA